MTLSLGLIASACSSPGTLQQFSMTQEEASLGAAAVALYLSPQHTNMDLTPTGYVVLADAEGAIRVIETGGMDNARLEWGSRGLFFSDSGHDYLLSDGLEIAKSGKPNYQEALFASPNGEEFIALYNDGGSVEGGYDELVVESDGNTSRSRRVEGMYQIIAQCDGRMLGVSAATGRYLSRYADDVVRDPVVGDIPPDVLIDLSSSADDGSEVLGVARTTEGAQYDNDAPCLDGVLYYLTYAIGPRDASADHSEPVGVPLLRAWDTKTGQRADIPLTDELGSPMDMDITSLLWAVYDEGSMEGQQFLWLHPDGRVMATDVETGRTSARFATESEISNDNDARGIFTDRALFVLDVPNQDRTQDLRLTRYDLASGERRVVMDIPYVNKEISIDLVLRDVALGPELRNGD